MITFLIMAAVLLALLLWMTCDSSTKVRVGLIAVAGTVWLMGYAFIGEGFWPQLLLTASVAVLSFILVCHYEESVDEETKTDLSDDPRDLIEQIRENDRKAAESRARSLGKKPAAESKAPVSPPRTMDRVHTAAAPVKPAVKDTTQRASVPAPTRTPQTAAAVDNTSENLERAKKRWVEEIKQQLEIKRAEINTARPRCAKLLSELNEQLQQSPLSCAADYEALQARTVKTRADVDTIIAQARKTLAEARDIALGNPLEEWEDYVDRLEAECINALTEFRKLINTPSWMKGD